MTESSVHHESPAQLAHYLRGISLPASKAQLKAEAEQNNAPPEMLELIDDLPVEQYHTMPDIMKAVGHVEHR